MELYISEQCLQFLLCAFLGSIAGVMYEIPRILRKFKEHHFAFVFLEDMLFCSTFSLIFICISYSVSDGIIRWYYYAGAFLGFIIYRLSLGRIMRRITPAIITALDKFLRLIKRFFIYPIAKSINTVIIFIKKVCRLGKSVRLKKMYPEQVQSSNENTRYF